MKAERRSVARVVATGALAETSGGEGVRASKIDRIPLSESTGVVKERSS